MIPGMPSLLKPSLKATAITLLSNALNAVYDYFVQPPKWGIYNPGSSDIAFLCSSIVELDISAESMVSDYPLETGSFTTYNKVRRPEFFAARVTKEGNDGIRNAFLAWLQLQKDSTNVFDVVAPDFIWPNVTLVSYRMSRTSRSGAAMIVADLVFQQVLEMPTPAAQGEITAPENQEQSPTVRVSPVPNPPNITATDLPPL